MCCIFLWLSFQLPSFIIAVAIINVNSEKVGSVTRTIRLDLNSTYNEKGRRIISINGSNNTFGPTIRVRAGDHLSIRVENMICSDEEINLSNVDELLREYCETAIHFHGLNGIGNNNDGVPLVTQSAIAPGEIFWYNFSVPEHACGTYWYHSHSSVQYGDGARGIFIVECDNYDKLFNSVAHYMEDIVEPDIGKLPVENMDTSFGKEIPERVITFSDYYNSWNLDILRRKVIGPENGPDPRVEGSLVNGRTELINFIYIPTSTRFLKFRILNTGMSGTQVFHIQGFKMVVIEIDGTLVEPFVLETLSLAVGQRVSILIKMKPNVKNIKMINGCNKMMGYITKYLVLTSDIENHDLTMDYIKIDHLPGLSKGELYKSLVPKEDEKEILTSQYLSNVNQSITLEYSYFSDSQTVSKFGTGMYKINGKTYDEYLLDPIIINGGKDIQIIINSIDHMRHPWHFHGHKFQVISVGERGDGSLNLQHQEGRAWNKYEHDTKRLMESEKPPMVRDSVNIEGNSFIVLRFRAVNITSKWLLHCHVEWHMMKGLGAIFQVISPSPKQIIHQQENYLPQNQDSSLTSKVTVFTVYTIIMIGIDALVYRWIMFFSDRRHTRNNRLS